MRDRKVSVVVPAFNAERYLCATLNSILGQSLTPHEIIVVNDGSTDSTLQIISDFSHVYSSVLVISQDNQGLPAARNAGKELATGNYIAFCDSDDLWEPEKLKRQVTYLEMHPEFLAAVSMYSTFTNNQIHRMSGRRPYLPINPRNLLWGTSWLPGSASSILMRNDPETAKLAFDESLTFAEDLDMWIQISTLGKIAILEFNDVLIRVHDESMQSVARNDPNIHLLSMLKITRKFTDKESYWMLWLTERLFFWFLLKEYILADRELLKNVNWEKVVESSSTLKIGRVHRVIDFSVSILLQSIRKMLIWSALLFRKLKQ